MSLYYNSLQESEQDRRDVARYAEKRRMTEEEKKKAEEVVAEEKRKSLL